MKNPPWTIAEVLQYVEHPERRVRCDTTGTHSDEQQPFIYVNGLGDRLSRFSAEDQLEYLSNFLDTLDQI